MLKNGLTGATPLVFKVSPKLFREANKDEQNQQSGHTFMLGRLTQPRSRFGISAAWLMSTPRPPEGLVLQGVNHIRPDCQA
jgi:hypothetical protein